MLPSQHDVAGEVGLGHAGGSIVGHVDAPLLVEAAEAHQVLDGGGRKEQPAGTPTFEPGTQDPTVDGDVIGVPCDAVRAERQDRVGPDLVDQPADP